MQNYNNQQRNYGSGGGYRDQALPANATNSYMKQDPGFHRRYVRNISPDQPNVDPVTGIRRKEICPELPVNFQEEDECDEAEDWNSNQMLAARLQALINQETNEIDAFNTYVEKVLEEDNKVPTSFREVAKKHKSRYGKTDVSLLDSEMYPELAAQLMKSEDKGASLKHLPPGTLYGRLFPEDKSLPKIKITAASKNRREDVLPMRSGMMHAQEDQLIEDLDAGIVDYYEIGSSKPSTAELPHRVAHEPERSRDGILGIVHEAKGETCPFKYVISAKTLIYGNLVQLRGTQPPPWFPGFLTLTSRSPEFASIDDSKEALDKAWGVMGPSQISSPHGNLLLGKR